MSNKNFSGIRNNSPLPDPKEMEIPDDIGSLLDEYIESASSMLDELEQATLEYEAAKQTISSQLAAAEAEYNRLLTTQTSPTWTDDKEQRYQLLKEKQRAGNL